MKLENSTGGQWKFKPIWLRFWGKVLMLPANTARSSGQTSGPTSVVTKGILLSHMCSKCPSVSLSVHVCCCKSVSGRRTAAPPFPPAFRWSPVHVQRSACSPPCPTLTSPSARWRATWGPDSCVMSSWWLERGGYLHTGGRRKTESYSERVVLTPRPGVSLSPETWRLYYCQLIQWAIIVIYNRNIQ